MMFILIELLFLIDVMVKAKIQIYSDTQSQFNYFNVEQFASLTLNKICLASTQPRTAQSFFYLEPVFALCLTRLIVAATHIKMCANASSAFDLATVLPPT